MVDYQFHLVICGIKRYYQLVIEDADLPPKIDSFNQLQQLEGHPKRA